MTRTELVLSSYPAVFIAQWGSVSVKRPVQDKHVPPCQRSSRASWWRTAEVSYAISKDVWRIESSIVLTGMNLETSSRIGFMMNIDGGEWTPGSIANWLSFSHASLENIQCVMGYIVDLTVILDDIFRTASGDVTEDAALKVMGHHVRSGRRNSLHQDIRSFVTFVISSPVRPASQKDLVLEKIIDLIRRYCSPFRE